MHDPMTKAARNALAWLHLTGLSPKYLHHRTAIAIIVRKDSVKVGEYKWREQVRPEYLPEVQNHPMVLKVRELEAEGWKIGEAEQQGRRRRVRSGVVLVRELDGRRQETSVYPDGKQCRVWG